MSGLGEILFESFRRRGASRAACFVTDEAALELTAEDLVRMARDAAGRLSALSLPPRSLVGVALYSGPRLHAAWLGCLWAGHIPTMIAPPSPRMEEAKYAAGLAGILRGLSIGALMVDAAVRDALAGYLTHAPPLVICDALSDGPAVAPVAVSESEVAVVQHSSGTTGQQKAVALTTAQVIAHHRAYGERLGITAADRVMSWLPLYHDMGFVAAFLQPMLAGLEIIEMSPFAWAANPALLLKSVATHRPTLCWMPNFAFALMAEPRVLRGLGDLDLSSVRAWINCSEPVMASSVDRFLGALAPYGVSAEAITASYAMAENVFAVTQSKPGEFVRRTFDRAGLQLGEARSAAGPDGGELVSNGRVLPSTELQVRGPEGEPLGADRIGEIHIRGEHRFEGYLGRPDLTAQAIDEDGWYATGDLGFVQDGEVYVTGRKKDLIIIRGRNYSAHEIEAALTALPGVKPGRVAAFSIPDPAIGTERLIVVAEGEDEAAGALGAGALGLEIRRTVAQVFDTTVSDVRIVPRRWLVKSTSGKVARADNREKYLRAWGDDAG